MRASLVLLTILSLTVAGCGGTRVYRSSQSWRVSPDAPTQVSDEDIARAFEARPQMPDRIRVAYFAFDPESRERLRDTLRELPGVDDVYEIAPLLVTGERRFDTAPPAAGELDLRRLRLLAARAQCDLLVVVDNGYRVEQDVNGWIALAPLIVPMLFTPHLDTTVESYFDAYLVDVRNGYLYGHVETTEEGHSEKDTVWNDVASRIAEEHYDALLTRTREALAQLLTEGRAG